MNPTCFYCGTEDGLRPYGPDRSPVCHPCVSSDPERNRAAEKMFHEEVFGVLESMPEGGILLLNSVTGEMMVMSAEELEEIGGMPTTDKENDE